MRRLDPLFTPTTVSFLGFARLPNNYSMSETATLTSASVSGQCSNKTGSNRISDPTLAADIPPSNPVKTETIEDLQILLEDLKVNACQE